MNSVRFRPERKSSKVFLESLHDRFFLGRRLYAELSQKIRQRSIADMLM